MNGPGLILTWDRAGENGYPSADERIGENSMQFLTKLGSGLAPGFMFFISL